MRSIPIVISVIAVLLAGCNSSSEKRVATGGPDGPAAQAAARGGAAVDRVVEAGCATCVYGMVDMVGCQLAVQIDGRVYAVRGSHIDDHGDAHAPNGLCRTTRTARVQGQIEGESFVASRFEVQP